MNKEVSSTTVIGKGNWIDLKRVEVTDNGKKLADWEYATRCRGGNPVQVIPWYKDDNGSLHVILVKQFRPALNAKVIEFPAGLQEAGETPKQAALRELKEETGYGTDRDDTVDDAAVLLGSEDECRQLFPISAGMSDEQCSFVLVNVDSTPGKQDLQDDESIEVIDFNVATACIDNYVNADTRVSASVALWLFGFAVGQC